MTHADLDAEVTELRTVRLEVSDGVAEVTLNRPERLNAMDLAMREDLVQVFVELAGMPLSAVIVTGAGRAFCAGGDLGEFASRSPQQAHEAMSRLSHRWFRTMWQLSCPVIAAVNGAAAGGGLSLALAADIVYAADDAELSCTFGAIGLTADLGALYLLPRLVGLRRAQSIALRGARLLAPEALELGLVTAVLPPGELLARARETADRFRSASPHALAATKRLLQRSYESSMEEMLGAELYAQAYLFGTDEHRAAVVELVGHQDPRSHDSVTEARSRG
ncbi:MAG TPA: enoyl-CoA hydratase/isomerase family protein [Nocardioides sp.]|jgi:enoyl-CoA hydratase/carnithine racemase|uniref:enoyl-CoA hydratase/isomerase family protein n=1 Tax=Nocardioides sp. TaxID=35761 RepID=UPI002E334059|nr:enoyl-CoA hydratase/isomerase family protein [Nocardioides sp.]HEX3930508.1 enoyl-CoA hydratase/isomerase family protein [Nocardioides sp.]